MDRSKLMEHLAEYVDQQTGIIDTYAMLNDMSNQGVDVLVAMYGPAPSDAAHDDALSMYLAAVQHNSYVRAHFDDAGIRDRATRSTNWLLPALVMLVSFVLTVAPLMVLS